MKISPTDRRFMMFDCWTDYLGWKDAWLGDLKSKENYAPNLVEKHILRLDNRFWWFDVGLPSVMTLAAIIAGVSQIRALP